MTSAVGSFWVGGIPVPQGSGIVRTTRDGRAFLAPDNSAALKKWRRAIGLQASLYVPAVPPDAAVWVRLRFAIGRPASVRRPFPAVRPDVDKLSRAVLDALTGVVYRDDGQVVHLSALKTYVPPGAEGVAISVGLVTNELDLPAGEGT